MLKYRNISIVISLILFAISYNILEDIIIKIFVPESRVEQILSVIFVILLLISHFIIYSIIMYIRKKQIEHLKQNGKLINARFIKITSKNRIVTRSTRASSLKFCKQYSIHCEGINPIDGTLMTFKSEEMNYDPICCVHENLILNVYIDINKPTRYYVDIDQIKEETNNYYSDILKRAMKAIR